MSEWNMNGFEAHLFAFLDLISFLHARIEAKIITCFHLSLCRVRLIFILTSLFSSAQKGVAVNMLKAGSKRRRTKAQVRAEKEEAQLRDQEIQEKLARLAETEAKLEHFERMAFENEQAKAVVGELHAAGQIDIDDKGNISASKRKR